MNNHEDYISSFYDRGCSLEWARLERHRTEYAITMRALQEHLPPPPARLLDCGGGPGRYAIALAGLGYPVTLFDLSPANLDLARRQADAAGVTLSAFEKGTALDLSRFPNASFDAVLLLGPLYHLLEVSERRQAVAEARRVLRPGGLLFASFLTRYAAHRDAAAKYPENVLSQAEIYDRIFITGRSDPPGGELEGFVAYFGHVAEAAPLLWQCGLEVRQVLGVEGLVSMIEEKINALEDDPWERWLDLNYTAASDPSIHGGVEHLLAIAINPAWRPVLRLITAALDQAGIGYNVAGGASLALHGVPVAVRDVDIEMEADDVYRFQELFAAYTVEPVRWKESEQYRSHFGRFEIDGVTVEVMGGFQRRQGPAWIDTRSRNRELLDLDGKRVWASWLEEETLANLRRGRLERAAGCLRLCDPERLAGLLTGAIETGVI